MEAGNTSPTGEGSRPVAVTELSDEDFESIKIPSESVVKASENAVLEDIRQIVK